MIHGAVATDLRQRAYQGEADLEPMVELINDAAAFDGSAGGASLQHLRDDLSAPEMEPAGDVRLWHAANGALAAVALLEVMPPGAYLDAVLYAFAGHPYRSSGLDDAIVGWAAARMRERAARHGIPARLLAAVGQDQPARLAALQRLGFEPVRYMLTMQRSLELPIPEPVLPEGFVLRTLAGAREVPAWVELYNQSFVDHFNHHDLTVDDRLHWFTERHYRAAQDIVAVAPDGTLAAFCKCYIDAEKNQRSGRNAGWVSLLGTRRGYRNRGLGRAMLYAGMAQLARDGVDIAQLGVDADSPTGATRLYQAAGFEVVSRRVALHKDL